jgi:hypothetical protein
MENTEIAKHFVENEKAAMALTGATPAIIIHRGNKLLGSVASIVPSDPEIVLCAHTSRIVPQDIIDAVLEISPRPTYSIDDNLDIAERQDVLRMVGTNLTIMTPEQTKIASEVIKEKGIFEI